MTSQVESIDLDLSGHCSIENVACMMNASVGHVHVIADATGVDSTQYSARDATAFTHCYVTLLESVAKLRPSLDVIFQLPSTHCAAASEQECVCTFQYANFADSFIKSCAMYSRVFRKLHNLHIRFAYT